MNKINEPALDLCIMSLNRGVLNPALWESSMWTESPEYVGQNRTGVQVTKNCITYIYSIFI